MNRHALIYGLTLALGAALSAAAQHATAPSGYYPMGYAGDIFTGVISATNPETNEVTLDYAHGRSHQTFVGVLPLEASGGVTVKTKDGQTHKIVLADFVPGTKMTVYYMVSSRKVGGKKIQVNTIFRFQIGNWDLTLPKSGT